MLDSMDRIAGYTAGMGREEFLSDRKTIDAVVRNLEVVGEAASRLTDAARFTTDGVGASDQPVPDSDFVNRWQYRRVALFLDKQ